jgi:hypothetical protein
MTQLGLSADFALEEPHRLRVVFVGTAKEFDGYVLAAAQVDGAPDHPGVAKPEFFDQLESARNRRL